MRNIRRMKAVCFLFVISFSISIKAQQFIDFREKQKPVIKSLKVSGIVSVCVGGGVVGLGFLLPALGSSSRGSNGSSNSSNSDRDEGNVFKGMGAGSIVTGVVLIIVGVSPRNHKNKLDIIVSEYKEIGLAYNF